MKSIIATTVLALLLGGAASASVSGDRERPDPVPTAAANEETMTVKAGSLYIAKDLTRVFLMENDDLEVSTFQPTGKVDRPSRDN